MFEKLRTGDALSLLGNFRLFGSGFEDVAEGEVFDAGPVKLVPIFVSPRLAERDEFVLGKLHGLCIVV